MRLFPLMFICNIILQDKDDFTKPQIGFADDTALYSQLSYIISDIVLDKITIKRIRAKCINYIDDSFRNILYRSEVFDVYYNRFDSYLENKKNSKSSVFFIPKKVNKS